MNGLEQGSTEDHLEQRASLNVCQADARAVQELPRTTPKTKTDSNRSQFRVYRDAADLHQALDELGVLP